MTAAERPGFSVVIVNRDTREMLRECLDAIRRQEDSPAPEVIVVDNGSTDGSVELVRNDFPEVTLVANDTNEGYARANNQGIAASSGAAVVLLNSDAVLSRSALRALDEFMATTPDAGAVGVRLLNTDGSLQRLSRGRTLSLASAANQLLLLSNLIPRVRAFRGFHVEGDITRPERIGWVSTACAVFRREALDAAGPMSETLVTYGTDIDLCQRIGRAGWAVYSVPVPVTHHGGASFPDAARSTMWFESLHALFATDHGPAATRVFDALVAVGFTMRAALNGLGAAISRSPERQRRSRAEWVTARVAAGRTFARERG